jgi:hypothetical protein
MFSVRHSNQSTTKVSEASTRRATAIVGIRNKSFYFRTVDVIDLSILRDARAIRNKEHILIVKAFTCLGSIIVYEFRGPLAKEIFLMLRYEYSY